MRADRCRQIPVTGIDDIKTHRQIGLTDGVSDLQPKRERIAGAGRSVIDQRQPAGGCTLLHPLETKIPRKAVLLHRIGFSAMPQFVAFHPPTIGNSTGEWRGHSGPACHSSSSPSAFLSEHSSAPSAVMMAAIALLRSVWLSAFKLPHPTLIIHEADHGNRRGARRCAPFPDGWLRDWQGSQTAKRLQSPIVARFIWTNEPEFEETAMPARSSV